MAPFTLILRKSENQTVLAVCMEQRCGGGGEGGEESYLIKNLRGVGLRGSGGGELFTISIARTAQREGF